MTTTVVNTGSTHAAERPAGSSRRWQVAGLGAGIAGIGSIVGSSLSGAVYEDRIAGDAVAITDRLAEMTSQILFFHTATMISCALLVVFAAGLHRDLRQRLGSYSLLPQVASYGLLLVAVALLMGGALTTEFVFGVADPGQIVPEVAAFFGHWIGTVPWLWGGAGLTGLVVAIAALRHRSYSRFIGSTSVVLGGLAAFFFVSPLQYMAGMVGPLWLTIFSIALLLSRRRGTLTKPGTWAPRATTRRTPLSVASWVPSGRPTETERNPDDHPADRLAARGLRAPHPGAAALRPPPAADPRGGRRPGRGHGDGLPAPAVEHLREGVGLAPRDDDP